MRQCPTIEGDFRPLIVQCIEVGLCMARQREMYHKCHRCVFRGQAADYLQPKRGGERTEASASRNGALPVVQPELADRVGKPINSTS
jgi:hypothetical protein